jgi:tetratricopeptide (TPR) repeat protein
LKSSGKNRLAAGVAAAILLSSFAVRADDEAIAKAKACFERGRAAYEQARYDEAVREFRDGYALSPRPLFLVNLGQAYRQLGRLDEAREEYRRFLEQAPSDDPQRPGVQRVMADLNQKIAERDAARERAHAMIVASPPAVVVVHKKPFIKRHWWIIPVSVAVVTGIVVGAVLGVRAQSPSIDCTGATLGCVR